MVLNSNMYKCNSNTHLSQRLTPDKGDYTLLMTAERGVSAKIYAESVIRCRWGNLGLDGLLYETIGDLG